jgi:hypothetical protein
MAGVTSLHFDVISGGMQITIAPPGVGAPPTISSGLAGSFDLTISGAMSGHIMTSDMVTVDDVDVANVTTMKTTLIGVATANILPGSARFTDFTTTVPGHLMGGFAMPTGSSYLETTILVVGAMVTTFSTGNWRPSPATVVTIIPSSSAIASDIITVVLDYGYGWEIGISDIAATLTLDFVVQLVGTAHVPEPALGSLVALGLGGAGAWLRRRRS